MGPRARLVGILLAGALVLGPAAHAAAESREVGVLWLLVLLRIDGFASTQVLTDQDKCEEARFAEMLSSRPKWKPEINMMSECVPVRMHDIRPQAPASRSR